VQALHDLGPAWVLDVEALNTLRDDTINIYSSSSYELSVFSSKAGSTHGGDEGVAQGTLLGTCASNHLPRVVAEGIISEAIEVTSSRQASTNKNKGKNKKTVHGGGPHRCHGQKYMKPSPAQD
jgi:hypothetical protein